MSKTQNKRIPEVPEKTRDGDNLFRQEGTAMKKQIINETFSLQIPDSFEILSETALLEMYRNSPNPFLWGARDRENHVVLLALWKKSPLFLSWVTDLKTVVKKDEQLTRKAHEGYVYRLLEFFSLQAGEEKAEGYRFSYEKEGITQISNNFLIRKGSTIYAFFGIGREENADADRDLIVRIMNSLESVDR